MKLKIIKKIHEARKEKERNKSKVFRYDDQFLASLKKPGKTTFIRFTDEMPGGGLFLTPNISKYTASHTPAAIYGYPLEEVRSNLVSQRLEFSHLPYIIVYWVQSDSIVNLNSITKNDLTDLVNQIISHGGQEKYLDAIGRWTARAKENGFRDDISIATSLLSQNGSVERISDNLAPKVFWNIVGNYGNTATGKTVLLSKLKLKQTDSEGKQTEKNFSTVLDANSIIDPKMLDDGESGVQGFTISSKYVDGYEIFQNPASYKERRSQGPGNKQSPEQILGVQNVHIFDTAKAAYLQQRPEIDQVIKQKIQFTKISNGMEIEFKLPGKSSYIQKYDKVDKNRLSRSVGLELQKYLEEVNGRKAYRPMVGFADDFANPGLRVASGPDTYSIKIFFNPGRVINVQDVYSLLYFLFLVYTDKMRESFNPFSNTKHYGKIVDSEARRLK